ncbi:MAG: hypothetical protein ACO4CG_10050 [Prochlorothrix sp.]|nr:hypothetical protein [Prochlorothrix sp.]
MGDLLQRLEQYSRSHPQEVLLLEAEVEGQREQVMIFKGMSSLLMGATAFDPDVPVLPETAQFVSLDRLHGPYNPQSPNYLAQGLTIEAVEQLLAPSAI